MVELLSCMSKALDSIHSTKTNIKITPNLYIYYSVVEIHHNCQWQELNCFQSLIIANNIGRNMSNVIQ